MNPIALLFLAFAMSTDAFATAIGKGAALRKTHIIEALRIGLIFGTIEAITPLVGWVLGKSAAEHVEAWDHWIAFSLLAVLSLHMIYEGLKPADGEEQHPKQQSLLRTCLTAFGTSIDAMAVGASLAFIDVNIWLTAGLIGLATTIMVTIGILLGGAIGSAIGHRAEIFGGVTLMAVGVWILYGHL